MYDFILSISVFTIICNELLPFTTQVFNRFWVTFHSFCYEIICEILMWFLSRFSPSKRNATMKNDPKRLMHGRINMAVEAEKKTAVYHIFFLSWVTIEENNVYRLTRYQCHAKTLR